MYDISITGAGAAVIALIHTLAGPDHYVPFIALSRANKWSNTKLVAVTSACGLAHVGSSILLGLLAALLGAAVTTVESIQEVAGSFAGWSLIIMGGVYAIWGLWRGRSGHSHAHIHFHGDGKLHRHSHGSHQASEETGHHEGHHKKSKGGLKAASPWLIFLIFAFGPCEPLIAFSFPMGATGDWGQLIWISGIFTVVTLVTMLAVVLVANRGLRELKFPFLSKYVHFLSGLAIFASGAGIMWLGL
jgi:nickel/cobalt transporter (NicO) family protein